MPKKKDDRSLSYWLSEKINKKIAQGVYPTGSMLESERDLCKEYGVSRTTVRTAIDLLDTKKIVEKYDGRGVVVLNPKIDAPSEQDIQKMQHFTVLFIRLISAMPSVEMHAGAKNYCDKNNIDLMLLDANQSHERLLSYLKHRPEIVNGVILRPYISPEYIRVINEIVHEGVEVVCAQRGLESAEVSTVCDDEFTAFYSATALLLKRMLGPVYFINFKRFGEICSDNANKGWRDAMLEYGNDDWEQYLYETYKTEYELCASTLEDHYDSAKVKALEIFQKEKERKRKFSIVTRNDHLGRGVYAAAEDAKLKPGKDFHIISYGDYPIAKLLEPQLSSIHSSPYNWGYQAMKILHERLKNKKGERKTLLTSTQLIERKTSGK